MIFSRLFNKKAPWQAKNINVRIAAINEQLDSGSPNKKDILVSLVGADDSELVRRAALLKLNSFDTYLLASQENNNDAIKKFASTQVSAILANDHELSLSDEQKLHFLQQNSSHDFINHWLEQEENPTIVIALFKQLAKKKHVTSLLLKVFSQKQNSQIQAQVLAQDLGELSDINFLTKLSKKSASESVKILIESKIKQLQLLVEQPKKLHKQLKLILSKLLALKEVVNYSVYMAKRQELTQEWQSGVEAISCLSAEIQETLIRKYTDIIEQLNKIFATKAEAYQQDIIAQQLIENKQAAQEIFADKIKSINQVITTAVFEDKVLDEQSINQQLTQLTEEIDSSVLNTQEQEIFTKQFSGLSKRLTKLPEIAKSVSQATHLISKMSQLAPPQDLAQLNERNTIYQHWLTQWSAVENTAEGFLPQSIIEAYNEISADWKSAVTPLQQKQKQVFHQTKKKLIDIKRLLNNGKYKVCFGLFKGINQSWNLLSEGQQHNLNHEYQQVDEKIKELSDWEHYIATPRKQALLRNITDLVNNPLDNPNDQANKVKQYRKAWNSLGHADESLEKALNEDFNQACEQAFAPCRLFYAEQETLRAQHLVARKQVIEQVVALVQSVDTKQVLQYSEQELVTHFKKLDGQLHKLQQAWEQAGEVDRKSYQSLSQQFKQAIAPLKQSIKTYHENNTNKKLALITKAEQELNSKDILQAIENIKQLQQQWRNIGFAGSHQENKLWQIFRKINDEIFACRDQIKTQQQVAQNKLAEQFHQDLQSIQSTVTTDSDKNLLTQALDQAQQLHSNVLANKPILKTMAKAIESFIKQVEERINAIASAQAHDNWVSLFCLLKKIIHNQQTIDDISQESMFARLNHFWQKRLIDVTQQSREADSNARLTKTLSIEVLAQVDSPSEYAQQRMVVQVKLMQEQMQSGATIDLTAQLIDWLMLGKLSEADAKQLTRLEKIFV